MNRSKSALLNAIVIGAMLIIVMKPPVQAEIKRPKGTAWAKAEGGKFMEAGQGIAFDPDGNIVVTGEIGSGNSNIGSVQLHKTGTFENMFLAKYDPEGSVKWAVQDTGTGFSRGLDVTTDNKGNIFVTGYVHKELILGDVQFQVPAPDNQVYQSLFTAKFDKDGRCLWARQGKPTDSKSYHGKSIATDQNGDVYVAAFFWELMDLGEMELRANGEGDVALVKYRGTDGHLLWAMSAGSAKTDHELGVAVDGAGGAYLALLDYFAETTAGRVTVPYDATTQRYHRSVVVKFDASDGSVLWAKRGMGSYEGPYPGGIAANKNGDIAVTGEIHVNTTERTMEFAGQTFTTAGNWDCYVYKMNNQGSVKWATVMGSSGSDCGRVIGMDDEGDVLVGGWFTGIATFGNFTLTSSGRDIFLVCLASDTGQVRWAQRFGGVGIDFPSGLALSDNGDIAITGHMNGPIDFSTCEIEPIGQSDILVFKLGDTLPSQTGTGLHRVK